jgi:hypothetical protein
MLSLENALPIRVRQGIGQAHFVLERISPSMAASRAKWASGGVCRAQLSNRVAASGYVGRREYVNLRLPWALDPIK